MDSTPLALRPQLPLLRSQCRWGHYHDAVGPCVGRRGHPTYDNEYGERLCSLVALHELFHRDEVCGRLVYLVCTELDLKGAPHALPQLDYSVNLVILRIPVVFEGPTERLGVDGKITLTERLEEESRGVEVTYEVACTDF